MQRGISIHIGVNEPASMPGAPLSQSEQNAWKMAELASQAGYQAIHLLRGPEATRHAVRTLLADAAHALQPRQTLFVSFCGHGSRVPDTDKDERDSHDETWCLADADLVDDELAGYWRLLPAGARAVVVAESCFGAGSGRLGSETAEWYKAPDAPPDQPVWFRASDGTPEQTVWRSGGFDTWRGVKQFAESSSSACTVRAPAQNDGIRASVLVLAAASEDRHAQENVYMERLLEVWRGGDFRGSYCDLHRQVLGQVTREMQPQPQEPQIVMLGATDLAFPDEVAFHLDGRRMQDGPVMRDGSMMRDGSVMRDGSMMRGGGF